MKRRNRVLGTLASFGFAMGIVFVALFFWLIFAQALTSGQTDFITIITNLFIIFDFSQTTVDVFVQYIVLGILGVGAILSLLWLILGLCRKHFIEILFFFLNAIFVFGFTINAFYLINIIVEQLVYASEIDVNLLVPAIIYLAAFLFPITLIFITFFYDMHRIFTHKKEDIPYVEAPEYTSKHLLEEIFPQGKSDNSLTAEEKAKIDRILTSTVEKIIADEEEHAPLKPEEIPNILYRKEEPVDEYEPLPFMKEDFVATSDEKAAEPVQHEEEEKPAILYRKDEPVDEYEPLPFMKEGFAATSDKKVVKPVEHKKEEAPAIVKTENTVKSNGKAYHLSFKEDSWLVKEAGSKIPLATFASEEEAVEFVRSSYPGSSIRIHDKNGKIHSI